MSNERIIENYKGFEIVSNFFRNEYQARVCIPGETRLEVRKCKSVQDAIEKAKAIVDEKSKYFGLKQIFGTFDLGYSADKHTICSVPIGTNEFGHTLFDTTRSEMGEALYQLKYKGDYSQVPVIAQHLSRILEKKLSDSKLIIPVPPSKSRPKQPVVEIARAVSQITNIPVNEALLTKCINTVQMKDVSSPEEKVQELEKALSVSSSIKCSGGPILLIDDLFDTGSSLSACANKIRALVPNEKIYALTVTRKHQ